MYEEWIRGCMKCLFVCADNNVIFLFRLIIMVIYIKRFLILNILTFFELMPLRDMIYSFNVLFILFIDILFRTIALIFHK